MKATDSRPTRVVADVVDHRLQLSSPHQRDDKRHLPKDRIRQRRRRRMRRIGTPLSLAALPESTDKGQNTTLHLAGNVDDAMEMVGHKAERQQFHFGETDRDSKKLLHDSIAQSGTFDLCDSRVCALRQPTEKRDRTVGLHEGDMVDTTTTPRRPRLLPMPSLRGCFFHQCKGTTFF